MPTRNFLCQVSLFSALITIPIACAAVKVPEYVWWAPGDRVYSSGHSEALWWWLIGNVILPGAAIADLAALVCGVWLLAGILCRKMRGAA